MKLIAKELRAKLPKAMLDAPRWLLWKSEEGDGPKPRKVPYYASGAKRYGVLDTPEDVARLVSFDVAVKALRAGDYTGPGFALGPVEPGNPASLYWQGVDLDELSQHPLLVPVGERMPGYIEGTPSADGLHAIGLGPRFATLGSNKSGIEAYSYGRFFTVTGNAVRGDIEDLAPFVVGTLVSLHGPSRSQTAAAAGPAGESFFSKVNHKAMQSLGEWVPALFPQAREYQGGYRIGSAQLGRALEEDLSIVPKGIRDFGEERGLTPIDLVVEWGPASDARGAAMWLCDRMRIDPAHLGWAEARKRSEGPPPPSDADAPFGMGGSPTEGSLVNAPEKPAKKLLFTWFKDTPEERPEWLWEGYILRKSTSVLGSKQGLGKGFVTADIAARLSNGWLMPPEPGRAGGEIAKPGTVLIVTREDDPSMALAPRLRVAGADMLNIAWTTGDLGTGADDVHSAAESMRAAAPYIEQMVTEHAVDLVIIDPLGAWVEDDSNSASQIRAVIDPMNQMARRTGCAVLFVAHIRKAPADDPMDAFAGSFAITAAVRTAMMMTPLNDKERMLMVVKSNFRKPEGPLVWSLVPGSMTDPTDPPKVDWRRADDTDQAIVAAKLQKGQSPVVDPADVRDLMGLEHQPIKEVARAVHRKLMPQIPGVRLAGVEDAIVQLIADGQAYAGIGHKGVRTVGLAPAKPSETSTDRAIRAWETLGPSATVRTVAEVARCSVGLASSAKRHAVFNEPCSVSDIDQLNDKKD